MAGADRPSSLLASPRYSSLQFGVLQNRLRLPHMSALQRHTVGCAIARPLNQPTASQLFSAERQHLNSSHYLINELLIAILVAFLSRLISGAGKLDFGSFMW